jgi:hypothetical protein
MIRCLAMDILLLRALAPEEVCLPSRCLVMDIHVIILYPILLLIMTHSQRCFRQEPHDCDFTLQISGSFAK